MRVVGNLHQTLLCQSKSNQFHSQPPDHIIQNPTMENTITLNLPSKMASKSIIKRPASQAFHRLNHWNKVNQEKRQKSAPKQPKLRRNYSDFNNFATETMILPKSKTYGYFRNAAHPRKARFITNIQGILLPTIFDESRGGRRHSPNPPPVGLSLPDILAFDQTRHTQVQDDRRTALNRMHSNTGLPTMFKSLQIGGRQQSSGWKDALGNMIDRLGVSLNVDVNNEETGENKQNGEKQPEPISDAESHILEIPKTLQFRPSTTQSNYDILAGKSFLPGTPEALKAEEKSRPSSVLEALDTERGVLGSANRRILQARLGGRRTNSGDSLSRSISTAVSDKVEKEFCDKNSTIRRIAGAVDGSQFTQEMMIYLLCQIFQTTHVEQVHKWLETAPEGDKEYVVGLLRTALE